MDHVFIAVKGADFVPAAVVPVSGHIRSKTDTTILSDDFSNDVNTIGTLTLGTPVRGEINYNNDSDWFKISLDEGNTWRD